MRQLVVVVVVVAGCNMSHDMSTPPHWYQSTPLPAPHVGHAACGGVVIGGPDHSTEVLTLQGWPEHPEWLGSAPLNIGRTDASCIAIPVNALGSDIYVFGGAAGMPGEVRRAGSHAWTVLRSPTPFETGAALVALDGKIFAFGGDGHHTNVYDTATDTWSQVAPAPLARKFAGVGAGEHGFLIIGGRDQDDQQDGIDTPTARVDAFQTYTQR